MAVRKLPLMPIVYSKISILIEEWGDLRKT